MRKRLRWFLFFYLIYLAALAGYFFIWSGHDIPSFAKGTPADPSQFMSEAQLEQSAALNAWRHFLTFAVYPLEWGLYLALMVYGVSCGMRKISERISRRYLIQIAIYFLMLSVLSAAIFFPFDLASHQLSVYYGISVERFPDWLRDQAVSFAVGSLISFIMLAVVFFFIRRYPRRWWLPVWLLAIPFVVFMMYVQPVLIDPLYHHYQSLQDSALQEKILGLAAHAHIPAENVYEVDMSEETNAMNAYVTGVGSHLRIVLWDTTVERLSDSEVLFIMAHEMAHYVKHHVAWGMALSLAGLLAALFLAAKCHLRIVQRLGARLNLHHPGDLAAIPIVLLLFSLFTFAAKPAENAVSRHFERQADEYAIQLTKDKKAAISSFQKISAASLGEIDPPELVRFMEYGHPTMLERIHYLEYGTWDLEDDR